MYKVPLNKGLYKKAKQYCGNVRSAKFYSDTKFDEVSLNQKNSPYSPAAP